MDASQTAIELSVRVAARAAALPPGRCLIVGLCGSQGSGKSTLASALKPLLEGHDVTAAVLSLDDLYLTRADRETLGREVHALLRTRGVPGTHDVAAGIAALAGLRSAGRIALPSFDKARDDRRPASAWPVVEGPVRVILFEGWCVGARPQPAELLAVPINALEREEDERGIWRRYVNDALAGDYQRLFAEIDCLIMLQAPHFECVHRWRLQQEEELRRRIAVGHGDASRLMTEQQIERFIAHFERLTRYMLEEMPGRCDLLVRLDAQRNMQVTELHR